jgi:hypothetical protein
MAKNKIKLDLEVDGLDKMNDQLEGAEKSADGLRKQFIEAKKEVDRLAGSDVVDQAALDAAIQKMAEMKDRMADVNEQVNVFASGSKYEQVSNAFGEIGGGIKNLDFGKAEERAQAFAKAASGITFKDAIGSVKSLGSTFMTLGKSLLTNPLFLLAAVIIGIVMAIGKVLDKLGILKKITEAVGAVFDWLMQKIEDAITAITDFFGITSEKEREATKALEEQAASYEKAAKSAEAKNASIIQGLDQEIRMAKLQGKSTEDLERKKVRLLAETAKAHMMAAQAAIAAARASGKASDEEIAKLQERVNATKTAYTQAVNDTKFFEAQITKEKQDAIKKEQEERDKANKAASDKRKSDAEKRKAEEKAFNDLRLATERQVQDLELANKKAGVDKELEINKVKYERLIADTLNNEKLLQTEKEALVAQFRLQAQANEDAINAENKDKEDAKILEDAEKERVRLQASADIKNEFKLRELESAKLFDDAQKLQADLDLQTEQARLREALDNKLLTEQEYQALLEQAALEHQANIEQIEKDSNDRRKAEDALLQSQKLDGVKNGLSTIGNLAELFNNGSRKSAEKAFKIQKGVQIATAGIDTFKSATAAFSSLAGIPVVGPALGAAAAAAAVAAGLLNIKKIASTKFDPGGGGGAPGAPAKPNMPDVAAAVSAPTPPSLFGNELSGSTGGNQQNAGARQGGGMMRAIVVESDITNTQNRLSNYQQRSEID